jgi:hypothetical protein
MTPLYPLSPQQRLPKDNTHKQQPRATTQTTPSPRAPSENSRLQCDPRNRPELERVWLLPGDAAAHFLHSRISPHAFDCAPSIVRHKLCVTAPDPEPEKAWSIGRYSRLRTPLASLPALPSSPMRLHIWRRYRARYIEPTCDEAGPASRRI